MRVRVDYLYVLQLLQLLVNLIPEFNLKQLHALWIQFRLLLLLRAPYALQSLPQALNEVLLVEIASVSLLEELLYFVRIGRSRVAVIVLGHEHTSSLIR